MPIEQVSRIERVRAEQIEYLGGRRTMQYRGSSLPVVTLHDAAAVGELTGEQRWVVIVFESMGQPLGVLAAEPLDMVETTLAVDTVTLRQPGVSGSAVLKTRTILMLDIFESGRPPHGPNGLNNWRRRSGRQVRADSPPCWWPTIRNFSAARCNVWWKPWAATCLAAEDGQAAWEILDQHAGDVDLVATDIEMPRLDGLALTRQIRADRRFTDLPIIALSSLAGEEEIARGFAAGVR